jgi:hypothetical protein
LGLIGWWLRINLEWHVVLRGRWRDGRVRGIVDGGRDGLQVDKAGGVLGTGLRCLARAQAFLLSLL